MAVSVTPLQTQIYTISALKSLFCQDQLAVAGPPQKILLSPVLDEDLVHPKIAHRYG
jgi:hypothetical protein